MAGASRIFAVLERYINTINPTPAQIPKPCKAYKPHQTLWFLAGNGGMGYWDNYCGLYRDYYRDPFPHSLLRTRQSRAAMVLCPHPTPRTMSSIRLRTRSCCIHHEEEHAIGPISYQVVQVVHQWCRPP